MSALGDDLATLAAAAPPVEEARRSRPAAPSGWEPGVAWDGNEGTLTTGPLESAPSDWDALLAVWDLDPAQHEVVEPVQFRAWDTASGQRLFYYRATIRSRRKHQGVDIAALEEVVSKHRPPKRRIEPQVGAAFVWPSGDLQVGKVDGGGSEATVARFLRSLDEQADRLKMLRRMGLPLTTVYLPWLGDCIEGFNSQGGKLVWRTDLSLTEQVRVIRRLMLKQVEVFAPLAAKVVVPVIPGNHDEAVRIGNSMGTTYEDSWAVEAGVAVADALRLNPDAFGHVSFVFPNKDELTLTLDIAGTVVTMAHGHQWRGASENAGKWWAQQAHGMTHAGDSTLLLCAHRHHLYVHTEGAKTVVQLPALDGGSTWFRHQTGQDAPAASLSLVVGDGGWGHLHVVAP